MNYYNWVWMEKTNSRGIKKSARALGDHKWRVASVIGAGSWPPGFLLDGNRARNVLHNLTEAAL